MFTYELTFNEANTRTRFLHGMEKVESSKYGNAMAGSGLYLCVVSCLFTMGVGVVDIYKEGERVLVAFREEIDVGQVEDSLNKRLRPKTKKEESVRLEKE